MSLKYLLLLLSTSVMAEDITPFFKVDMLDFKTKPFVKNDVKSWTPQPPKNTSWNGSQDFFTKLVSDNAMDLFNRGKQNDDDVKAIDDKVRHLGKIFSVKSKDKPQDTPKDPAVTSQEPVPPTPDKDMFKYEFNVDVIKLKAVALMKTDYFELKSELIRTDLNTGIYIGNLEIVHRIVDRFSTTRETLGFNKQF
jgi:hypothetical protein